MRITCFQCRQQLDVPEDSAGRRVRCLHCQYVIVVPSAPKPMSVESEVVAPMTALPSLELDAEPAQPIATKVSPTPLPPIDPIPVPAAAEPTKPAKKSKYDDDLPPLPAIDRPGRRRVPMTPLPTGVRWGRIIGIGAVILVVLIGVIAGVMSSRANRPRHVVFNPQPPMPPQMPFQQFPNPPIIQGGQPPFQLPNMGGAQVPGNFPWREHFNATHRFRAQLPGEPQKVLQAAQGGAVTYFDTKLPGWEFAVGHRMLPERQPPAINEAFQSIEFHIVTQTGAQRLLESQTTMAGVHPVRDWNMIIQNTQNQLYVRTMLIREGTNQHQFVLTVRAPNPVARFHPDVVRFFNSFVPLIGADGAGGQVVHEEIDDVAHGTRCDREFTALAVHPKQAMVVLGSSTGNAWIGEPNRKISFAIGNGTPIRHATFSPDGAWLALVGERDVHVWHAWQPDKPAVVNPGRAALFTRKQRLLIADGAHIQDYACKSNELRPIAAFPIANVAVEGLALSEDERTLAVYGGSKIELWNWADQKALGIIDAHEGPITAVVFSRDGKTLATAGTDRAIKLWNVDGRTERATLKQHAWTPAALAFSPDGKHLVSGGLDGMVLAWNLQQNPPRLVWAESHQFPVRALAFDAEGNLYLTCKHALPSDASTRKQCLRQLRKIVWADIADDTKTAERLLAERGGLRLLGSTGSLGSLQISVDGKTIVATDNDNAIGTTCRIIDAGAATVRHSFPAFPGTAIAPDGKSLLCIAEPQQLQVMDLQSLNLRPEKLALNTSNFPRVFFTSSGKSVWIQQANQLLHLELPSLKALQPPLELKKPGDQTVIAIHPSADRKSFLVERTQPTAGLRRRTLHLHSSADGKELPLAKHVVGEWSAFVRLSRPVGTGVVIEDVVHNMSQTVGQQRNFFAHGVISRDRKFAVSAEMPTEQPLRLILWNLEERRPILSVPERGARAASALRLSDDGKLIAILTSAGWTRIVPTDWLMERKNLLAVNPNDVGAP